MAARGFVEILPGAPFYIYIANLSAKSFSLPENIIAASTTNALPRIIHPRHDELDMLDEPTVQHDTGEQRVSGNK